MIPVFEPEVLPEDMAAVQAALQRGEVSGSFGKALEDFEREFAAYSGCRHGIATTSGTTALELACAVAGRGPAGAVKPDAADTASPEELEYRSAS